MEIDYKYADALVDKYLKRIEEQGTIGSIMLEYYIFAAILEAYAGYREAYERTH